MKQKYILPIAKINNFLIYIIYITIQKMQKKKMMCSKHFNQIDRFCISETCELPQSSMCIECQNIHNHEQSISVKAEIIEKMLKVQRNNASNKQQDQFIKQSMQTVGFIKTNLKNTIIRTINNIFSNYQTALRLFEKPQENFDEKLCKKNSQQIRKLYFYGKEKQKGKSQQINPKLIRYFLEFKVVIKQFIEKLKQLFNFANFSQFTQIDDVPNQKTQKFKDYSLEKLELLLNQIKIPTQNYKKQDVNKNVKQAKQKNQSKDFEGGLAQISKCMNTYATLPNLYFQKAFILFQLKQYEKAYINYSICIQLDGSLDIAYNNRGLCLNSLKLYNEAINNFQKSIKKNVKYPNPYLNKGISYQCLDKLQQALCCYQKALQIKPDYQNAKLYKSQIENTIKSKKKNA